MSGDKTENTDQKLKYNAEKIVPGVLNASYREVSLCPLRVRRNMMVIYCFRTLDVPSLVATALIVPGSPTSTTTFYVNFSVICARTGGSR